jgi:endonuclease/exonuclease/phosphatase (EEP) superfamily protein YafD
LNFSKPSRLTGTAGLIVGGLVAGSVLGYLEGVYWFFGLFVHFRHVYLLGALACLPIFAWGRFWRWVVVLSAVALLNAAYVVPWYIGSSDPGCSSGETVRVVMANLLTSNRNYGAIRRFIDRTEPDVLVLLEYASHLERGLESTLDEFDHRLTRRRRDNFGMAVYSDIPWQSTEVVRPAGGPAPQFHVVLRHRDEPVHLWTVHPLPPVTPSYARQRDDLLAYVGRRSAEVDGPVVVAGDLNTTMWSPAYRDLEARGFANARVGRGLLPTWPSSLSVLPIDHVLHTDEVATCGMRVGPAIGSDHRPLVVDLEL